MFTNQNQSSGKFWVSAFIVGLLIFLGQFANSQNGDWSKAEIVTLGSRPAKTMCRSKCGPGVCYYPESVSNINGAGCQCGNNFCLSCKTGWRKNPNSTGASDRCIQGEERPSEEAGGSKSDPTACPSDDQELKIVVATGRGAEKSACVCKSNGKEPEGGKCPSSSTSSSNTDLNQLCRNAKGVLGFEIGGGQTFRADTCVCVGNDESKAYAFNPEVDLCNPNNTAANPAKEDDDAKFNRVLSECKFDETEAKVNQCSSKAISALDKCDAQAIKSESNAKQLGGVMRLLGTVQQNKAVEHADPDACGTAAYMGSAATLAIDAFKKTCEDEVKECKESCNPFKPEQSNFNELKQACVNAYNNEFGAVQTAAGRTARSSRITDKTNAAKKATDGQVNDHQISRDLIVEMVGELEKQAKDNLVKCESDAVKGEADIGNYLAEILTSSMAAAQCRNQASNSAARCAGLAAQLTPQYCDGKCGSEICCAPYCGTIVDCNGKDYSSKQCVCARSPDSAICRTVTSSPPPTLTNPGGVANLAAPGGIKAGSQYKPSGTVGAGGFEVGTDMDPSKATPNAATGGSSNPFGVARDGGGGGGGGGVPNSPNDGAAAAPAAAEGAGSGLVGGAFNQLKTLADRVFGSGGSGNANNKKDFGNGTGKDGKKNGDANGKPGLRGVAGGSKEVGPRNKDIWKIMNVQYGIQNHTFISNEK